jgi:glycosyltransferase involved in cell wall biosynthesis
MFESIVETAAAMGIGRSVLFAGFLRGADVSRAFAMADLYVMPSVSEPFGIAPLEAISHNVPVMISKSSGVSEVVRNVLKVDFWDIDQMADRNISVLRHPSLADTLRAKANQEIQELTWDKAARGCEAIYGRILGANAGFRGERHVA